ncbi:MAG TPA: AAA family ATPase [Anaerolineales bacterium]|nr:AAA family ATPase [Anaerolineales bacterium]
MPKRKPQDEQPVSMDVGHIQDVSGELNIAGRDIIKGYTAEQVSVLLAQIKSDFQLRKFDGTCPYKGLEVFEEEDAELFFGRERLVDELVKCVMDSRTVFITGPSGSGKSSLVRAGLIHALKQGAIRDLHSERWLYETMKPGREPINDLALAFSRLKSPELANYFRAHSGEMGALNECIDSVLSGNKDQRFVLFIDQFEEVFTQVNQEEERAAFLNMLVHAGTIQHGRVIVLFAMRSDFISNCATYPALNELLSREFRQIGAMQPEELVSAIAQPALRVGLRIDTDLVAQIINDMKGEPGALPLMQFALKDLFDSQHELDGVLGLTLNDYLQRGGIRTSLARHADRSFARLSAGEQELARSIFSGLIEIGHGTSDTRRTALFAELIPANSRAEDVRAIVQKLADARLIITDEKAGRDTVTILHEKMIEAWPWLKKLVNENRAVIALQNEIANAAKEWEDHQHDPSYLYTGARLASAHEKLDANQIVLSGPAQLFIETSAKAYADELEAARQRANQLRRRSLYLTGALGVALIAVYAAVFYWYKSIQREANARAGELALQSVSFRNAQLDRSLLLSIEAFRTSDIPRTRSVLFDNVQLDPASLISLGGHAEMVWGVAFSPNGKMLASGSCEKLDDNLLCTQGEVLLWDVSAALNTSLKTRQSVGQPLNPPAEVFSVAFSPDSKILAAGSEDGTVTLWDTGTHQPIGQPLKGHRHYVTGVAFSPDGKLLASSSGDRTIILWDVATQRRIGEPFVGHLYPVTSIAFSPDGKTLASGSTDRTVILWDVKTHQPIGQPLAGHIESVYSVAFNPNGKMLASGSADKTIILWDVKTHRPIGQPLIGHTDSVNSVAFGPDGKLLASGSADKHVILWDIASHQPIGQPLTGQTDWVNSVAFSPDGRLLASGSCGKLDQNSSCVQGAILLRDISPQSWIEKACQRAHRNFTYEEWVQYFPDQEYRKTCQQWPSDPSYYRAIAQKLLSNSEGPQRVQNVIRDVTLQMKRDASIKDPDAESDKIVGETIAAQITIEERAGKLQQALQLLEQARNLQLKINYADSLNEICWDGSLQGHAGEVLPYCEQAVALAPQDGDVRDSRGLARALTGDYPGAVADFQFFIDHSNSSDTDLRQQWIAELKAGRNPLTPDVLETLLDE